MARYCQSLTQENNSFVMHNAFLLNRQPDFLYTNTGITKSSSKTSTQRYPQQLSTRPPGRKMKPSDNTCKRITEQGRFDILAPVLLHLSYSYARRVYPFDSAQTTKFLNISRYLISTICHPSGNYLTTPGAESGSQG